VDDDAEFLRVVGERLTGLGFSLTEERRRGELDGMQRYDNGIVVIVLIWELMATANLSVTMGGRGGTSFAAHVWADFLGVPKPGNKSGIDALATPQEALDFFIANLEMAEQKVSVTPDLEEALTEINWEYVKRRLGIDPDEPRPGQRS